MAMIFKAFKIDRKIVEKIEALAARRYEGNFSMAARYLLISGLEKESKEIADLSAKVGLKVK